MHQLPVRQIPAWAVMLDRAKTEFESLLPLEENSLRDVAGWMFLEHVLCDLALDGIKVDRARLAGLLDGVIPPVNADDRLAVNYGLAVRYLSDCATGVSAAALTGAESLVVSSRPELTLEVLRSLHRIALADEDSRAGQWRERRATPLYPSQDPCLPEALPVLLALAMDWFSAESLQELHPLEQAAIVHLRLNELQPFDRGTGRIARLASSLYAMRAGLPPIILDPAEASGYYQALLSGFQMNTTPLVEVFAKAGERTLRHMIELARVGSG